MAGPKIGSFRRGRYESLFDAKPPPYTGPHWIGKAITTPQLEAGPNWIGQRIPFRSMASRRDPLPASDKIGA